MKRKAKPPTGCKKEPQCSLRREEWDFRAFSTKGEKKKKPSSGSFEWLPDDEVSLCWFYEFTRSGRDTEFVIEARKGAKDPSNFKSLLEHYWRADPNGKHGMAPVVQWYQYLWPEWPEKPFLSVKPRERKARYKAMWEGNPKRNLSVVPIRGIYRFVQEAKAGRQPDKKLINLPKRAQVEMQHESWIVRKPDRGTDNDPPMEIVAFQIDFNLGKGALATQFANWVEARCDEKGYSRRGNAGTGPTKSDRADLKALGALRLLEAGLSIPQAMEYTERKENGEVSLFRHAGDWSRARKRAQEALFQAS